VAGRALAFSDPELIRLATAEFVPVTGDDWYQRRRDDAEGRFFRGVADQGPRKGEGGSTRQGIYCFTAGGKLLAYKNSTDARVMRETLRQGLARWKGLPAAERKPAAVEVPELTRVDPRYTRTLPAGGLVVKSYTRILDRDGKGALVKGSCDRAGGDRAARDHLWLTREDWQSLVPADPRKGDRFPMPPRLARRLLRFHLLDNTRGEPPSWGDDEVRAQSLTWAVEAVTPAEVRLSLRGTALLATAADPAKARRGFDAALLGHLHYDRSRKVITRLDLLAAGDHWGEGTFTRGARPGRRPLGVAFELSPGKEPADRVPPQAARAIDEYWGAAR
jgi:hypothetical protein